MSINMNKIFKFQQLKYIPSPPTFLPPPPKIINEQLFIISSWSCNEHVPSSWVQPGRGLGRDRCRVVYRVIFLKGAIAVTNTDQV